ncbi:MAG: hypothetical protein CMO19_03780 [Thaumarchaeota archaeon]|nr:hypothetical protein [Nitrososphaerota archaeon]|tara:strand:- start:685 stop:1251 length:567 start_codon:yes stop_codon:yes gene_type:complete
MKIHLEKQALRAMGIAECYFPNSKKSTLCSVIMRSDLVVDGSIYGESTVGGDDVTENILLMYEKINRDDINCILILGSIMSSYNVVDLNLLNKLLNLPIVSVSLKSPKNLENNFMTKFPNSWKNKLKTYTKNDISQKIIMKTEYSIYIQSSGISLSDAKKILDKFTLQGSLPEPLRLAKLFARAKLIK